MHPQLAAQVDVRYEFTITRGGFYERLYLTAEEANALRDAISTALGN